MRGPGGPGLSLIFPEPEIRIGPVRARPGPPVAGAVVAPPVAVGVSGGLLVLPDPKLHPGLVGGGHLSFRFTEWFSLKVDAATATMGDADGGNLTVTPITVGPVFSLPMVVYGHQGGRPLYLRLGVAGGVALLSHSDYSLPVMGAFRPQAGIEWTFYGGRSFVVGDLLIGGEVEDDTGIATWDLGGSVMLRVGIEFGY